MRDMEGSDKGLMKIAKWLYSQGQCNGSAVVSPFPVYSADRASDSSGLRRPRRVTEKVIGLLGPENLAQQRQIHALLEQSKDCQSDSDDDYESDYQPQPAPSHPAYRSERPPRLDLRNFQRDVLPPPARSGGADGSFRFPATAAASSGQDVYRPRQRAQGFPLPPRTSEVFRLSPAYYSPAPSIQYFESSPVYRNAPSPLPSQWQTPCSSPRLLSPRGAEDGIHFEESFRFSRGQSNIFAYPEPPSPYMSMPQSPYVSAPQSPYHTVRRSFNHAPYPYSPSPASAMEVERTATIGWGSYGTVYKGRYTQTGMPVAIKALHSDEVSAKEIALLSRLDHQHIVKYHGTTTLEDGRFSILLELMQCSLASLIKDSRSLDETRIRDYTRQILYGLEYLHRMKIVHRDIKCANILLDFKGVAKLGDFGLAKRIEFSIAKSCKGTFFYMAPEVLLTSGQAQYGLAADIWSLGCTVIEMAGGKHPWSGFGILPFYECMRQGQCPPIPKRLSPEAVDFVRSCLTRQPGRRPSASTLLRHPFVNKNPVNV